MEWLAEYEQIRDQYHAIGVRHRAALAERWAQRQFPHDLWCDVADAGLFRAALGGQMKRQVLTYAAATHGLTSGSCHLGFNISTGVQAILTIPILDQYASQEVREAYLAPAVSGKIILAFATTEPHGGSDAFHPETRLRRGPGGLYLDGAKWHITNAPIADVFLVWCADEATGGMSAVLVESSWPDVNCSPPLAPAGMRTSPVGSIRFDSVAIPKTHVLGAGRGNEILHGVIGPERLLSGFGTIGILDQVLDQMLAFSINRQVRGKPIAPHQHIQRRISDVAVSRQMTIALAHSTLARYLRDESIDLESAALKLYGMQAGLDGCIDAMKLCGSYGLQEEARLYQCALDFLCGSVAGGTEEAMRLVIARELAKSHHERSSKLLQESRADEGSSNVASLRQWERVRGVGAWRQIHEREWR